jgi:hypothetical protein
MSTHAIALTVFCTAAIVVPIVELRTEGAITKRQWFVIYIVLALSASVMLTVADRR